MEDETRVALLEIGTGIAEFRASTAEVRAGMAELRSNVAASLAEVRTDLASLDHKVDMVIDELAAFRAECNTHSRRDAA